MFVWVNLPAQIDSMKLLEEAVAQNVAFVPGGPFFANEAQHNTLRLSFVTVPPAKIDEGVARLAALIRATRLSAPGTRRLPNSLLTKDMSWLKQTCTTS